MMQTSLSSQLVDVAVPLPLNTTFTYSVPPQFADGLRIGLRVLAPFGRRLITGYCIGFPTEAPLQEIKEIADVLDAEPLFDEADLRFFQWVAAYYLYPLGLTIRTGLPAGLTIEYIDAFSLTDAGHQALEQLIVPDYGLAIARALAGAKSLSLKTLEKKAGRQGLAYSLRLLQQQGLIAAVQRKKAAGVGIKTEKWFSSAGGASAQGLKGKQIELFRHIADSGPVSTGALRLLCGPCAAQLAALEKKGLIVFVERECLRRPPDSEQIFIEPVHTPTRQQQQIIEGLQQPLAQRVFYPVLLHGVTGSGKTEIYLTVMARVMREGRQCLYLVPEIALTAQLYDRISSRLQVPIAMLHSSLTDAERYDAWRMIRRGQVQVVVGARSAIFASFKDLGAIIVDEEHDSSYKQDDSLRYNARDLAIVKARDAACMVLLGSATPCLETYTNARTGKYHFAELKTRIEDRTLPRVTIIDMRVETALRRKKAGIISKPLKEALAQRLDQGRQSLLFLNRRGFAPVHLCRQCGHTFRCPNCSVALIHHLSSKSLTCHYCDFTIAVPQQCPACQGLFLDSMGWGTERLEAELSGLFPAARIARMDRDTTSQRGSTHKILSDMHHGLIDILIGTQMIVKGYHLPGVTLVGVVCADQSLSMPDYRAAERTFQLLTQVAGRSGRGELPGEVIIQTYNPEHYSVTCAARHDYRAFYDREVRFRRDLKYPPFGKLVNIRCEGTNGRDVEALAQQIGASCRKICQTGLDTATIEVLGPVKAPWEKMKGRYRFQMLLKGSGSQALKNCAAGAMQEHADTIKRSGVKVIVDIDPMLLM
jgi:primosomal protein N' (replication factor Y)